MKSVLILRRPSARSVSARRCPPLRSGRLRLCNAQTHLRGAGARGRAATATTRRLLHHRDHQHANHCRKLTRSLALPPSRKRTQVINAFLPFFLFVSLSFLSLSPDKLEFADKCAAEAGGIHGLVDCCFEWPAGMEAYSEIALTISSRASRRPAQQDEYHSCHGADSSGCALIGCGSSRTRGRAIMRIEQRLTRNLHPSLFSQRSSSLRIASLLRCVMRENKSPTGTHPARSSLAPQTTASLQIYLSQRSAPSLSCR